MHVCSPVSHTEGLGLCSKERVNKTKTAHYLGICSDSDVNVGNMPSWFFNFAYVKDPAFFFLFKILAVKE